MNDFITAWQAVDQHVAVIVFLFACASFTGWVLYGEHTQARRDRARQEANQATLAHIAATDPTNRDRALQTLGGVR